ncbi:hypothetical protein [Chitinimonas sp.]|uniref:hypothetical protein n=1 Tax=Chitinimonas sp. TaxID=1934313 RepID=UPI002F92D9A9
MGLNWAAIALGAIVDIVSSTVLGILVIVLAGSLLADSTLSSAELLKQLDASPVFVLISSAVGLFCSGLGGYVAGIRTNNRPLLHAAYAAGPSALLNLATLLGLIEDTQPGWWVAIAMLLSICASIAGGVYARERRHRS